MKIANGTIFILGALVVVSGYLVWKWCRGQGVWERFRRWRESRASHAASTQADAAAPPVASWQVVGSSSEAASPQAQVKSTKSAREVFEEAFPGVKVAPAPLPGVDFAMRTELLRLRSSDTVKARWELRIDVQGSIHVTTACDLDLVVSVEDVTDGSARPVYAGLERYQDARTGLFRLLTSLGALKPPGRPDNGWTAVGLIPLDVLQGPRSGRRRLRLACIGVPSSSSRLSLIDKAFIASRVCSAETVVEAELSLIGYVEQSEARMVGAGLVVSLAVALVQEEGWDVAAATERVRPWIGRHVASMHADHPGESAKIQEAMEQGLALSTRVPLSVDLLSRQLGKVPAAELHVAALRLCIELGRALGVVPFRRMVELARELDVPVERLNQLLGEQDASVDYAALEQELGLSPAWPAERIKRHLREQFSKWNAQSLFAQTEEHRARIQRKLDAVAKLQRRYG